MSGVFRGNGRMGRLKRIEWMSLAAVVGLLGCQVSRLAADWPAWRGEGTGVSTERNLPIVWHEERSIVWRCALPPWGTSSPVVAGGAVFVTTRTEEDKLLLIKIDAKSGAEEWTRAVGQGTGEREGPKRHPRKEHRFYSFAGPTPAATSEVVVVHFGNGDLAAYDFRGERLWKR